VRDRKTITELLDGLVYPLTRPHVDTNPDDFHLFVTQNKSSFPYSDRDTQDANQDKESIIYAYISSLLIFVHSPYINYSSNIRRQYDF